MNILIAMDSFKGCMTSKALNTTIKAILLDINPALNITTVPIADGGEGTVDALSSLTTTTKHMVSVHNPLMETIETSYVQLEQTAIMEMAACCGLNTILFDKRNPLKTTTYGLGEMIKDAVNRGIKSFIIGLGGSATNDAGIGVLAALGYSFYDKFDNKLDPTGENLQKIQRIVIPNQPIIPKDTTFKLACDVNNPFYGPNGAAQVFAPQKGANEAMVFQLDNGLKHYAELLKTNYNIDIQSIEGSGAAGGLPAAFLPFFDTTLEKGISLIFKTLTLESKIKQADLIITGEGSIDKQTLMDKAPFGVVQLAKRYDKPVILLCGSLTPEGNQLLEYGATVIQSIHPQNTKISASMLTEAYTKQKLREILIHLKKYFV